MHPITQTRNSDSTGNRVPQILAVARAGIPLRWRTDARVKKPASPEQRCIVRRHLVRNPRAGFSRSRAGRGRDVEVARAPVHTPRRAAWRASPRSLRPGRASRRRVAGASAAGVWLTCRSARLDSEKRKSSQFHWVRRLSLFPPRAHGRRLGCGCPPDSGQSRARARSPSWALSRRPAAFFTRPACTWARASGIRASEPWMSEIASSQPDPPGVERRVNEARARAACALQASNTRQFLTCWCGW